MTTIQLSDAQFAQFTATGLIVVDGIEDNFPMGVDVPSPWRELTDPCPTCAHAYHKGSLLVLSPKGRKLRREPCPAGCAGGRQVVTLTATCPRCHGVGDPGPWDGCKGTGVVELGRFTITALLPVVRYFTGTPALRVNTAGPLVYVAANGATPEGAETIDWHDLGQLPQPGQFAIKFEPVPE